MAKTFNINAFSSSDMLTSRTDDYRSVTRRVPPKYRRRKIASTIIIHIKLKTSR